MKKRFCTAACLIFCALLFTASPCWAKAKGYCYVVGYSYQLKQAYFSPIFALDVRDVSYSNEEYTTDVELIQKMESRFQNYLARNQNLDIAKYTISARGAYKNETIGIKRLMTEREDYKRKGFQAKVLKDFKFTD